MANGIKETQLWSWLRQSRLEYKTKLHLIRIENIVSSGVPDVEGCLVGKSFWIELKCAAMPCKLTTLIKPIFQPKQEEWHSIRNRANGQSFVLLQIGKGANAYRYLFSGQLIPEIKKGHTLDWFVINSYFSTTNPSPIAIIYYAAFGKK